MSFWFVTLLSFNLIIIILLLVTIGFEIWFILRFEISLKYEDEINEEEIKKDYGLLGGVIEFSNSIYFVKAVGNNDLVKANKSNFNKFVYSISLK